MKFSTFAVAAVLSISGSQGFTPTQNFLHHLQQQPLQQQQQRKQTEIAVAGTPPTTTSNQQFTIQEEILSGRVLEGGEVIDFEAVKGPSLAENALLEAKQEILLRGGVSSSTTDAPLLGINNDVITAVGHDLGRFANPEDTQKCASYIRSMAPPNLLQKRTNAQDDDNSIDKEVFQSIITSAYKESGEVTEAFAKTFYLGTMLLPPKSREAIWAIYVWCRRTDEIVDAPRDNDDDMLSDLSSWEMRLENLWNYGDVVDAYDLCLLDVRIKYPELEITPFMDMIRGMLMDVPGLGQERYNNFDELHLYCYRVAGTVGLMSLPIFGTAPGVTYEQAREPALSLGVALQITNILRDVGEDATERGRVYLPEEDMAQFGVTKTQILEQRVDENYINLMKYEIAKARNYYERARRGVFMLAPESRLPVQTSLDAYGTILAKIEENGYDTLTTRAYVGKWEKLSIIPFSWYRTLDISKQLPLPGDKHVSPS